MNIKRFTLLTMCGLTAISGVLLLNKAPKENYFPRESKLFTQQQKVSSGYFDYMSSLRNNRETGFISTAEIVDAKSHAVKMRKSKKSLGITWRFKGPDNVGGRTRALIIDRMDTNHLIAGAVSGGLWESFNGAVTWQPYDSDFKISNVSSIAQATDGTFYVGTGSTFERGTFDRKGVNSAFSGSGLYKLTGDGNSELLENAKPISSLSFQVDWWAINQIAVDPNNSQRILAATNNGLRESVDGGDNWTILIPSPFNSPCQNVHFTNNGKVVVSFGNVIHYSTDNGVNFNANTFAGARRIELAIAPSNNDIMYASIVRTDNCLLGVYKSLDAGATWSLIPDTPDFMGGGLGCQGDYDNTIAVYPDNSGKLIVGGISLYQWNQSSTDPAAPEGEWNIIATTSEFLIDDSRNPAYVHADKHALVFHPTNSNKLFIGSDGGVGFSQNMNDRNPSYGQYNLGYNVTQFYDIAVGPNDLVAGGTQDNGTQLVGFGFNTGKSSIEVEGGDGFDTELFTINPSIGIASIYNGNLTRLQGIGSSLAGSNLSTASIYSGTLQGLCGNDDGGIIEGCSPEFYTTTAIWESFNHTLTKDSVFARQEVRDTLPPLTAGKSMSYKSKNNNWPLLGLLNEDLFPIDTVTSDDIFVLDKTAGIGVNSTTTIFTAFDEIIIDDTSTTASVNGTITFNYRGKTSETVGFSYGVPQTYENIFHNRNVDNSPLTISIDTLNGDGGVRTIRYQDPEVIFVYEKEFPDIVQSNLALLNVRGRVDSNERNIWISKDILKGGNVNEPRWFKITGRQSFPTPAPRFSDALTATFSIDGDHLFYGTDQGEVYRVDGINDIDISQLPVTTSDEQIIMDRVTTLHRIGGFGNRAVTGITVDPQNADNIVVTLGNYGQAQYVQRSTNATASSGVVFTNISGVGSDALPDAPVYEAVIDRKDNNKVIIATELGVFATENAFDNTMIGGDVDVKWTEENTGLGRVPVMSIKQMRFGPEVGASNEGKIYIGTHGRGIFETDQLVGLDEIIPRNSDKASSRPELKVYPNPVVENINVDLILYSRDIVNIQIYNITGQLVMEENLSGLNIGNNKVSLNLSDLEKGTYIIRSVQNDEVGAARFIKQ